MTKQAEIISKDGKFYIRRKRGFLGFLNSMERFKFLEKSKYNENYWWSDWKDATESRTLEEAEKLWKKAKAKWKEIEELQKSKVVKELN